ncbi:ATP-dependent zinc protease family protein [Paraferrimonas sedimenticola]|uniref:Ribosomal protein S6 modification protein n=1 Tax=Paraferrimonas sedimenticola TaxID=375674 RepID=A0AA37VVX3_9GAMM|nr:ATP-dependent zinc protease [Paraferrimonas sedimenticola]GLP96294.1 ribosomal protein S6 modification protein [Paraferrimonas sedimenticola]
MKQKMIIGNLEMCQLPDLGISDLQVRIDTGAKTSSLHVDNLKRIKKNGRPWVKFDLHPDIHSVDELVACEAPLHDIRRVKSSNGVSQERYVIKSTLNLGGQSWPIEITLTDRSDMSYLMLLGREGMAKRVLVDPSQTFLLSEDGE